MLNRSKTLKYGSFIFMLGICCLGCKEKIATIPASYSYSKPDYERVSIHPSADTLHFVLGEDTYNHIKSFNIFHHQGKDYLSFLESRSQSINIYEFQTQKLVSRIKLKKLLKGRTLQKNSVFTKSFDSIFITNKSKLYLTDTAGKILMSQEFIKNDRVVSITFDNTTPPIINQNRLYASVRKSVDETSLDEINNWRLVYGLDLQNEKADLYYHLPQLYRKDLFGYQFLDFSYCYNHKGNFVFSFPADTNIYETDLSSVNRAYFGKSKYQTSDILPVPKKELEDSESSFDNYLKRDSYGEIFFDPLQKRYIRVVKSKISPVDYRSKKSKRQCRFMVFNENFQIIGESPVDHSIEYNSVFFLGDGQMFARTRGDDEYALHFIKLNYVEKPSTDFLVSKK